jgi:hypothetical protein
VITQRHGFGRVLSECARLESGTPQFRIRETRASDAPTYLFYGQPEVEADLTGMTAGELPKKRIQTYDHVATIDPGDIVFSLISGRAAAARPCHRSYLLTQNYVRLTPSDEIDGRFLVYTLNEDPGVRRQLQSGQQGSATLKHTVRQLGSLVLQALPEREKQVAIAELYFSQLRLAALKRRVAAAETTILIEKLKKAGRP